MAVPWLVVWAWLVAPGASVSAQPVGVEQRFAEAQSAFVAAQVKLAEAGDEPLEARRMFRESAEQFAAIARDGVPTANVCVNAGNAYHFAGDSPRALLWYLRAGERSHAGEIRSGLATLRRVCQAELWPSPRGSIARVLLFWHYDLGGRLKQMILLSSYPIGCAFLIIGVLGSGHARRWRRAGLALMLAGGVMGVSDAIVSAGEGEGWAVVLEPAKGLAGDGRMYSTVVESIVPGQEVRLREVRRDWVEVELPSGARCWIPGEACEPVRLPERDRA